LLVIDSRGELLYRLAFLVFQIGVYLLLE